MNKKRKIKQNLQAYSFLLPNLILFIVCTLFPFVCLFNKKARKKASGIIKTIFPKPYTNVFATLFQ